MKQLRIAMGGLMRTAGAVARSVLLAVLVSSWTAAAEPPSQTLFGEGYKRLYQQDQQMMHEMMETMQTMMGMMKTMAQGDDKAKITLKMERMDALMKEHANRPSEAFFGEGYSRLYQKDRQIVHEMMEMMNDVMGMMKEMVQEPATKQKIGKMMEHVDTMMKAHTEAPLKALFGEGYPFQSR